MTAKVLRVSYCVALVLLAGCSDLASLLFTPTPVPLSTATAAPQTVVTPTAAPEDGARTLRVWLPPRFDPNGDSASSELLRQRIAEFASQHPGLVIDIRIKAEQGEAGLLNSLSITSMAAPSAMPDLIALTHSDMESAVLKGLLHPLDGLTTLLQDPDWYAYARQMGRVQNTAYGLPFASDALVVLYRPAVFAEPPSNWDSIFSSGNQIVYPPSDPQAFFSLALYLSVADQPLESSQGALMIDEDALVRALSFHQSAIERGIVPLGIKDFQNDQQILQIYREGTAGMAVIRASSDLRSKSGQFAPLPDLNDAPYTLVDGWVWALAGEDHDNQLLAVELAARLVESDFLSDWTGASGYLPTRPQALGGWEDDELRRSVDDVLQFAHPLPSDDVMAVLAPLLQKAVMRVYSGEQPEAVARSVIEELR
jgi:multiple sugar transport system substrate-binding protein